MEAIRCRCSADKTFVHRMKSVSVFCLSGVAWEKKNVRVVLASVITKYFESARNFHHISRLVWTLCSGPADNLDQWMLCRSAMPSPDFCIPLFRNLTEHSDCWTTAQHQVFGHVARPLSRGYLSVHHPERTTYTNERWTWFEYAWDPAERLATARCSLWSMACQALSLRL